MFNFNLYLLAYGKIYANQGAMTPGASAETADGMSEDKIHKIIEAVRSERYRFSPAEIKDQLARFLRGELALELSPDKTLITHARTRAARYLGYEIIVQHADRKITRGRRTGTPLGSDACRATQTGRCYDNNVPLQGGWSLLLESRRYPGQFNKMEQRGHRYPGRSQSEAGVRQRPV
jgi:hypothetical protein